jgi:hypothetical protein
MFNPTSNIISATINFLYITGEKEISLHSTIHLHQKKPLARRHSQATHHSFGR